MQAGELSKKVSLLAYAGGAWAVSKSIWIAAEYASKVIYSALAAGSQGYKVTARRSAGVTQHMALMIDGNHCMITAMRAGLIYVEMDAAIVSPQLCTLRRKNADVRTFYGSLAERYVSWAQQNPNAGVETGMLLVTPKAEELRSGDIIAVGNSRYSVRECHVADQYHNDYEIAKVCDA